MAKQIKLVKSLIGRKSDQIATAHSLGLKKIKFKGNAGVGIISDTDAQPIVINSHLGKFAIVTVAKINNLDELETEAGKQSPTAD